MNDSEQQAERQSILSFWWMLELFSPQQIPKLTRRSSSPVDRQVIEWSLDKPLPWETLPVPKPNGSTPRVWRHTVYLGVYAVENTYQHLRRIFVEDEDAYDERASAQSACAAILIDSQGHMIEDTAVLSSTLWAVGRVLESGVLNPGWADGFKTAHADFRDAVDTRVAFEREEQGIDEAPVLDASAIQQLTKLAHHASAVTSHGELATDKIVIESQAVSERQSVNGTDMDFLNSFFLDDLATVRHQVESGDIGTALKQYLTGDAFIDMADRVDVIQQPQVVDAQTAAHRIPKGRWPSKPAHSMALSQQFAVNQAIHDLGSRTGIMGVNGPPGTGKTTMLRDILAANVVERAKRLVTLQHPHNAFTGHEYRWSGQHGYSRVVPALKSELTGFEMIVASANNGAVENITTEIPAASAIDASCWSTADYFGDLATAILQETAQAGSDQDDSVAWGLVAARLGKKSNRSEFRSKLWFDRHEDGLQSAGAGLQTLLKQWATGQVEHRTWPEARKHFRSAQDRVGELITERSAAQQRMATLQALVQRDTTLQADIDSWQAELEKLKRRLATVARDEQQVLVTKQAAEQSYDRQFCSKPGLLENLFSFGRAGRQWRQKLEPYQAALEDAEEQYTKVLHQRQHFNEAVDAAERTRAQVSAELTQLRNQRCEVETRCAQDQKRYGAGYPDEHWSEEQRELRAPWLDAELDRARSDLFLAALDLHQDFLANTADKMSHGLRAAMDVVAGDFPAKLEREKICAAWQLFFLLVPLVSTTFASFSRMFGDVGREAFGWLLIDEAGQAAPQQAAGAIWCAQRVISVGDPLQLQPVITVPKKLLSNMAATYGVSSTWIPPEASVQTLADRFSKYGTTLPQGDTDMWVSAPLRVHRRCHNPMFDICNAIAYDGIMVHSVPPTSDNTLTAQLFDDRAGGPKIAWSYWANEPAANSGTHLQPNEIVRLEKALAYLTQHGVATSDVIAISPFRDVADKLRSFAARYPGLQAGTIHTAQGKEAAIVILVLGGDPANPSAKAWAASSVNLLNVAISRAQRRLYVIGDRQQWEQHQYFRELSAALK